MAEKKNSISKKTNDKKSELRKELTKLAKNIDEEGLLFLIQQANVLVYNKQVDKINHEQDKLKKSTSKTSKTVKTNGSKLVIDIIQNENKSSFIIQMDTIRKFVSREDFRGMVKVCQAAGTITELSANLYRWLSKERNDFLIDNNIRSKSDPRLPELIKYIKSRYKAKS